MFHFSFCILKQTNCWKEYQSYCFIR